MTVPSLMACDLATVGERVQHRCVGFHVQVSRLIEHRVLEARARISV
jgi:hypothetical protein